MSNIIISTPRQDLPPGIVPNQIVAVKAPDGRLVNVKAPEAAKQYGLSWIYDNTEEVATKENPPKPCPNESSWRACHDVNYLEYGYIQIGMIWVDKTNKEHIAAARERTLSSRVSLLQKTKKGCCTIQ